MSKRATATVTLRTAAIWISLSFSCLLGGPAGGQTDTDRAAEERVSRTSRHGDGGQAASVTEERHRALVTVGERSHTERHAASGKTMTAQASPSDEFWIFYADVRLFNDDDEDGYFHGIDLLLDADTIYQEADVYAALYLSLEGGPWNEYAVTDTFRIFGATSDDEYVVITELLSGYPTGSYDLLIDLYDTFDGRLVATLGPEDTSALALLPLEDFNRDDPRRGRFGHGGGALDFWTVLAVLLYVVAAVLVRGRRRLR